MSERLITGVLGASSPVGHYLVPRLADDHRLVFAYSRQAFDREPAGGVRWRRLPLNPSDATEDHRIVDWLSLAPIWVLPEYFPLLERCGVRRVVALSSTSLFTKSDSSVAAENVVAARLADGEARLKAWADNRGVEWVILRPTLIYGLGLDRNISEIARFIRRCRFFPILGEADGLRQPVHAEDVAAACIPALKIPEAANRAYNIAGGEVLPYREMVGRIFAALDQPVRFLNIPPALFRFFVKCLRMVPRYRHWTVAMAERMNRDQIFDYSEAAADLLFFPRPFRPGPKDLP